MSGQPWLTLVGIGADGPDGLGREAREALVEAELLAGGARHLAMLPEDGRPRLVWGSPLAASLAELLTHRGRQVVVLATGDPLWHGIGRLLLRHVPFPEIRVLPHVSAFQLACSRLGWALEDTHPLSLHGRPLEQLRRHLQPGRRLLLLTSDGAAPAAIGALLVEAGFGASHVVVLEELSGPRERVVATTAAALRGERFAELNVVAVTLDPAAPGLPEIPGLPDEAYAHDGQLTKAEVRAATLAALAPLDGQLLWDVGAGAGSIGIEWLRSGRNMRAVAIERDPVRAERIGLNAKRLGVPELEVRVGEAPDALESLPPPDAIFVGGGVAGAGLLASCWGKLRPGGRLVANTVTIAGEAALLAFRAEHGGSLVRIALSRAESIGGQLAWRPALPVIQLSTRKTCVAASSSA
ncbi:precorrin-6y C5,15-methyltransferase (decarboxylating) subunit CbiE [Benzoatithermus flavus]|uniref:Precorrin-6y C5,15-methyltransferase (Decarboxylating) subunit CbiE n=1 Tax=Benzoatithermus flavus TaxID=3108223 RepID=A0ABU8XK29_9PROT